MSNIGLKIRKLFKKVWDKLDAILERIDSEVKNYAPIAIKACNGLKKAIEDGTYDSVALVIDLMFPGDQSKWAAIGKDYLSKKLPTVICSLQLADILAGIDADDVEGQFKAVYKYLTTANKDAMNATLLMLASDLINVFSDGKFTTAERHTIVEKYHTLLN